METYLGLDLSLTATGVGVLSGGETHGYAIKPPVGLRGITRLEWIEKRVLEAVDTYGNSIRGIAIEGYSMNSKSRQFALGELGGVIRLALRRKYLPVAIVPPKTLKMIVAGNGNASKEDMVSAVNTRLGFAVGKGDRSKAGDRIKDHNVADGIALTVVAEMRFGTGPAFTGVPARFVKSMRELELLPTARVRSRG